MHRHQHTGTRTVTRPADAVARLGTILGVWAHPDDETYLSGGLMALARRNGQPVTVLTATPGGAGTPDPDRLPPERLGAVRRAELRAAFDCLGVVDHHVAGHEDGACATVPLADGAHLVGSWLRRVRPDTIVTFGPDGMTGHPDHRAVSAWTTAAWDATGRTARLLHATVTPAFHEAWGDVNERLGLWEGAPPCTAPEDLALSLELDERLLDVKEAALRAHRSQVGPLLDALGADAFRRWWAVETFTDGAAAASPAAVPASTGSRARRS